MIRRSGGQRRLARLLGVTGVMCVVVSMGLIGVRFLDDGVGSRPQTSPDGMVMAASANPTNSPVGVTTSAFGGPDSAPAAPDDEGMVHVDTATPTTTTATTSTAATASTTKTATPTTLVADLLGPIDRGAALPDRIEPRPRPIALQTSDIDVTDYPIRAIGLEPDGQLEIPDETEIGWYRYGATAGRNGATVLAAHVSWNGTNGPFAHLDTLDPGTQIEVELDDGSARNYEVTERVLYEKQGLPRERIWRNTGPETLVLITCGGDFNPEIRRFRHNVVVYAVPLG